MSLLTWRLMVRRGWERVLPVLSLYVIFSSVAVVILFGLVLLQQRAGTLQPLFCRLYSAGDQITGFLSPLLLAAAIAELAKHKSGQNAQARRSYTLAVTVGMVSLTTLSACLIVMAASSPTSRFLYATFSLANPIASLVTIALVLRCLVAVGPRPPGLERSLDLIAIIVGVYCILELIWGFIVGTKPTQKPSVVVGQILWIAYTTLLYWALAREPRSNQALLPIQQ
jgi:hypothetical protein